MTLESILALCSTPVWPATQQVLRHTLCNDNFIAKMKQRANMITIVKVNYYIAGIFCGKKDFREQLGITELS